MLIKNKGIHTMLNGLVGFPVELDSHNNKYIQGKRVPLLIEHMKCER